MNGFLGKHRAGVLLGVLLASLAPIRADVLIGVNGERFEGKVLKENLKTVVFQSDIAGKMTIPRDRIREIQRTPPAEFKAPAAPTAAPSTNAPAAKAPVNTNLWWHPPGAGLDG